MKKIVIMSVLCVMLLTSICFAALKKEPAFLLEKFKMKLGVDQSIGAIIRGTDIKVDNLVSSNPGVVRVMPDGYLKAVSTGISTLTYKYTNSNDEAKEIYCFVEVTVNDATYDEVIGTKAETINIMLDLGEYKIQIESGKGAIPNIPVIKKENYVLEGWYKEPELENKVASNERFSKDTVLYSKWITLEESENKIRPNSAEYDDINEHWARNAIETVTALGLFNGVEDRKFGPEITMSRAMAVTVIGRLAKANVEGKESKVSDVVSGSYYDSYVAWAVENKIVNDIDGDKFRPNDPITREEVAMYMKNYIDYCGYKYEIKLDPSYKDTKGLSEDALDAIAALYNLQIMQGLSVEDFGPKASATRAQMAQIFYNFNNFVNKYKV